MDGGGNKLNVFDFVFAKETIADIEKNSVGMVKEIKENTTVVFFIGKKKEMEVSNESIEFLNVKLTGKPYPKKICNICHILKNDYEFDVNQTDAQGRKTSRPSCKICRVRIDGAYLLPTESKRMDKVKPKHLFTCPLCGKTSIVDVTANLVKDHNHITGLAREWICDSCNTGLGRFKDDVALLQIAIEYLKKFEI